MHDQTSVRAADQAALENLLVSLGIGSLVSGLFQPKAGMGYAYKGLAGVGGVQLVGVHGLIWWDKVADSEGEKAERASIVAALRAENATFEDPRQLIYGMMTLGYSVPQGWEWIKRERDARKLSGGFKVGTKWFHSDRDSRAQQLGLIIAAGAGAIPAGLQWKTMDGSFVPMTAQLAQQIFGTAMASDAQYHAVAEQAKAALEAGTLKDVRAIVWPARFEG